MVKIGRKTESRPITEDEGRKIKLMDFIPSQVMVTGRGKDDINT